MNIMYRPQNNYEDVDLVGIAVTRDPHTAFLYLNEDDSDKPYLMHLNGYEQLLNETVRGKYVWVDLPLTEVQKFGVLDLIEKIFNQSNGKIPYDIASEAFFENTGKLILKDEFGGFTCSTFVLSVFDTLANPLIKYDTWPRTQTNKVDIDRWAPIVKILRKHIFKDKKNKYLRRIIRFFRGNLRRYRPEEVASAGSKVGHPHSYDDIKSDSKKILETLKKVS